jgi:hypothetical protein
MDRTSNVIASIDDDEAMQDSLHDLLEAAGLVARCYGSAEEFLESDLRTQAACLIVDIHMPKRQQPYGEIVAEFRFRKAASMAGSALPRACPRSKINCRRLTTNRGFSPSSGRPRLPDFDRVRFADCGSTTTKVTYSRYGVQSGGRSSKTPKLRKTKRIQVQYRSLVPFAFFSTRSSRPTAVSFPTKLAARSICITSPSV